MYDLNSIYGNSDKQLLKQVGAFIKQHRLSQNKTQQQLSKLAGINRGTLAEFENGKAVNLLTFIQLLRSLNLLHMLAPFNYVPQLSPLIVAEMEHKMRKRASKSRIKKNRPPSDW